ncbi:regulatory protein viviparous-1-like [Canna indica]|uniref:Regulatory protein viviparous-1-like n=1 Tax=Canna indica TaxID=4628 RepID=A0AAQ3L0B5_9LILI|nr:regulatory protein viviparous-1-like [Canna indica]
MLLNGQSMADHEGEERLLGGGVGGGGGYHPAIMEDYVFDASAGGEDLFFNETLPSFPDVIPCLSSPSSASTCFPVKMSRVLSSCSSTSSLSSPSSSWSTHFQVPDCGGLVDVLRPHRPADVVPAGTNEMARLAPPPPSPVINHQYQSSEFSDDLCFLDGHHGLSSLFDHSDAAARGAAVAVREAQPAEGGRFPGRGEGGQQEEEEDDNYSEDVSVVVSEWLRKNKDAISPEDLKNIKLKRSTVEYAASRFGESKQGRARMVKVILDWVQSNHIQRKRLRPSFPLAADHQHQPFPITTPTHSQLGYNSGIAGSSLAPAGYNSWMPYSLAAMPQGSGGGVEMGCPGSANAPYLHRHNQPLLPLHDLVVPPPETWSGQQLPTSLPQFEPFHNPPSMAAGFAEQRPGHLMYHQGEGEALGAAAFRTKEARMRRIERQKQRLASRDRRSRREHPLQQQQQQQKQAVAIGSSSSDAMNWSSWRSTTSSPYQMSHHMARSTLDSFDMHLSLPEEVLGAQPPPPLESQYCGAAASLPVKCQGWNDEKNSRLLLKKMLRQSDVGSLGRIVLPKKEAETYLPVLNSRDGITIPMEDMDTSQVWNIRYRYWPNNKSRMYVLENTGEFVRSNDLQDGDYIMIYYSNITSGKYLIRGVKSQQPEKQIWSPEMEELAGATRGTDMEENDNEESSSLLEY